jgi:hypothetical protein
MAHPELFLTFENLATAVGISMPPAWNFGSSFGSRAAPPGEALGSNCENFRQHSQNKVRSRWVMAAIERNQLSTVSYRVLSSCTYLEQNVFVRMLFPE